MARIGEFRRAQELLNQVATVFFRAASDSLRGMEAFPVVIAMNVG